MQFKHPVMYLVCPDWMSSRTLGDLFLDEGQLKCMDLRFPASTLVRHSASDIIRQVPCSHTCQTSCVWHYQTRFLLPHLSDIVRLTLSVTFPAPTLVRHRASDIIRQVSCSNTCQTSCVWHYQTSFLLRHLSDIVRLTLSDKFTANDYLKRYCK